MEEVSCRSCGACVLVEKFSPQHTSVQWNNAAHARCTELPGGHTCAALHDSIDAAVHSGRLGVSTRDADVSTRGRAAFVPSHERGR
ncbi:hypothetical protein NONO_c58780 [Nocardia nova SH22a]|uniref:Ferredoxin n=1 Tax=Nocardia nova SH22a TaxID=1415166 RepID=W5TMS1_9NOCA|nr:hypothetical protein [Nocardia nova]AHH20655.1 hypothetical protein NONO_c58780 [Nocardia nova SH22a]